MSKNIVQGNGHRWTTEELKQLISLWVDDVSVDEIASQLNSTKYAITKQVTKLRQNGIPIPRRKKGNFSGRHNQLWTQEEVEYLVRRRNNQATAEQIGCELGRTFNSVQAMIMKIKQEGVPIEMLGHGTRRLWDANALKAAIVGRNLVPLKIVAK